MDEITVKSNGIVRTKNGMNPRASYEHQRQAMRCLDVINKEKKFSTLVVLPTGGGKTYTASTWLLKNAVNKNKKILWLAHRTMLLDQAAESFQRFCYSENLPDVNEFSYRIISGSTHHDRAIDIDPKDNILIIGKDSIGRRLSSLDKWLENEKEIFVIVDEAHHATAKTYRKVLNYIKERVENIKLIGLTATPTRTSINEQGLLAKIFQDGVNNDRIAVTNDLGITYSVSLQELINRRILAKPIQKVFYTDENFGDLSASDISQIMRNDLTDKVAEKMAQSAGRNKLIVNKYFENQEEYGQTIVFATNIVHAIALCKLFNENGRIADYIISSVVDAATGASISKEDNDRKIKEYQEGKLKVLVNVNILTEGVDLPSTKTVFLARPTLSTILMTQMIGRALRGPAAGGTEEAYIVSFVDDWNDLIAWVNPETIFNGDNEFVDPKYQYMHKNIRTISIAKIEEFARILDEQVDTTGWESIDFIERIPVGMYLFEYTTEDGDVSCQVMVYDNSIKSYETMLRELPDLIKEFGIEDEEYPSDDIISQIEEFCSDAYFSGYMIPPYKSEDIENIIRYFVQKDCAPKFYRFEDVDRKKINVKEIAQNIYDSDWGARKIDEYLDGIWDNEDENIIKLFFGKKAYFLKQVDIELMKIRRPDFYADMESNIKYGKKKMEDLPLAEIKKYDPKLEFRLRNDAFSKSIDENGFYTCACCGKKYWSRVNLQVDHIIAMNNGGKSVPENLQILCKSCNAKKSDKQ